MTHEQARQSFVTDQGRKVSDHWARLAVTFDGAVKSLEAKGISAKSARAEDLHSMDMIHMGGLSATDALAELAGISRGHHVLDVGSGVGGPARRIASKFKASIVGLELSKALYETSKQLTDLVGLTSKVQFVNDSALSLPFDDGAFDVVIMQHVSQQISEKDRLFGELARVVKPDGCIALHEIFAGHGEVHYPLPWAAEPSMSALETVSACIDRLSRLGFEIGEFIDHSEDGRKFHLSALATYDKALADNKGALGLSNNVVEVRRAASVAMERNLGSGSVKVGMLVARKAA